MVSIWEILLGLLALLILAGVAGGAIVLVVWLARRGKPLPPIIPAATRGRPSPQSPANCPRCGAALPTDTPQGLCPRCVLGVGLATHTEEAGESGPNGTRVVQPPPAPDAIAGHFPQLEILECLGRGGMGAVYKARQPKLNRLVALKILAPEKGADPKFAERFLREAQALARLNHPNIVTVHDFGEADGLYYLLMEYVDGVTLRQLLQSRKIAPEEALSIVPKICEALQFAHERGVVHRDIKPENVLLDQQGRVKIADFGIAKLVSADGPRPALTEEQSVIGTPHYMAPEQIEKPLLVDHRADIYSLGVVFYEMLTGELPLGKFQPPSKKVQVDVRLDEVVLHALEKEPERRYQQVSQVKTDVETIASTSKKSELPTPDSAMDQSLRTAATGQEPRFSRTAIWGAVWAPSFLLGGLLFYTVHPIPLPGVSPPGRLLWWVTFLVVTLIPLGLTAPFGTTILGSIAISQIRQSSGRLYGLGLAVFDTLLYPLLLLDALICAIWFLVMKLFVVWLHSRGVQPWDGRGFDHLLIAIWLLVTLAASACVDFLIARRVWRAVNRPPAGGQSASPPGAIPVPSAPRSGSAWRAVAIVSAVMLVLAALAGFLSLTFYRGSLSRQEPLSAEVPADAAQTSRSLFPKAAHVSRDNYSVMIHYHDIDLHYALLYEGQFGSSSRGSNNPQTKAWTDNGTITLKNSRTFGYSRDSSDPEHLRINGREFDLRQGRVFTLHDDGTVKQLALFPSLAIARDVQQLARLVENGGVAEVPSQDSAHDFVAQHYPELGQKALDAARSFVKEHQWTMRKELGEQQRVVLKATDQAGKYITFEEATMANGTARFTIITEPGAELSAQQIGAAIWRRLGWVDASPPAPTPTARAPVVRAEAGTYQVTLTNGITVEVVAVTRNPLVSWLWWKPDGTLLPRPPGEPGEFWPSGMWTRKSVASNDCAILVRFGGRMTPQCQRSQEYTPRGEVIGHLEVKDVGTADVLRFPPGAKEATMHVATAAERPWEPVAVFDGARTRVLVEGSQVLCTHLRHDADGRCLDVSHNVDRGQYALRMMARFKSGKRVQVGLHSGVLSAGETQGFVWLDPSEPDLRAGDIAEFVLERAPWVSGEIRGIALSPRPSTTLTPPSFGPVIERELGGWPSLDCTVLDLDQGRLLVVPTNIVAVSMNNPRPMLNWMVQHGADLTVTAGAGAGLHLDDGVLLRLAGGATFETVEVSTVRRQLGDRGGAQDVSIPEAEVKAQPVFLYRTREGGMGVLQVLGLSQNPFNLRIRFKAALSVQ